MPRYVRILNLSAIILGFVSLLLVVVDAFVSPKPAINVVRGVSLGTAIILLASATLLRPHRQAIANVLAVLGCVLAVLSFGLVIQFISR